MTSHDAMIQTMSHLFAFSKKRAKLRKKNNVRKFFYKKMQFVLEYLRNLEKMSTFASFLTAKIKGI